MFKDRLYRPVSYHDTWISIDPIQGCPYNCSYCILRYSGINNMEPKQVLDAGECVQKLLQYPLFINDQIPIAIGNETDIFYKQNIDYLLNLLKEIKKKQIHNPLVIITKSPLRKEILKAVSEIGLKVIFFLSYSGLGPSYERGIDRKKLQENFFLVKAYNFPLVHFWRPLIPTLNTHIRDLQDMLSFVSSIADATVFIGLKLHPELNRIIYAEGEIPIPDSSMDKKGEWLEEKTINRIYKEANRICPHYPLYRHSSCAIAALLHIPNHTATLYRNDICPPSQCPEAQREICENSRRIPDENEITKGLAVLERHIDFERHTNAVWINSEISQEEFAFLIHQFNFPLKTKKIKMQNLFYGDIYKNQTKIDENS